MPAGIDLVDRGAWSWLMTVYSLGVLVFGLRELLAGLRMRRQSHAEAGDPPHLQAIGATMPPALRRFHRGPGLRTALGMAQVRTGGVIAKTLLRFIGIGLRDGEQALAVTFSPDGAGELWTRQFCTGRFTSRIEAGEPGTLVEFFGPFSFRIALSVQDDGLYWTLKRARFLGVPLPSALAPRIAAREWQNEEGSYSMSAQIAVPLLGMLLDYRAVLSQPHEGRAP